MADWSTRLPRNLWDLKVLAQGISGLVSIVDDNTVIKHPLGGEDNARDHIIERRIYERLGQHPRIVRLISLE
jgi:serine/threonine protein kinase